MRVRLLIVGVAALTALTGCGQPGPATARAGVAGGVPSTAAGSGSGTSGSGSGTSGPMPGPSTSGPAPSIPRVPDARPAPTTPRPAATTAPACPYPASGFDCAMQRRIAAAEAYQRARPGVTGIVVRDRVSGAVWRNSYAGTLIWTASTIKLAMTIDLFLRDRAGAIALTAADRDLIQRMLHSSDDDAADTLWFRYAGADHQAFNRDFPRYGMASLQPQRGFTDYYPYWGFQKCTADDLDRLINYVLTKLPADLRTYIVGQLRTVATDQQWGVWGAGPAEHPGNKDGWSLEQGGWVMNSVGFVGPGERYTLAMMNSLRGEGGYSDGQRTDTRIAALLFA